jgi:iron complex outermembrane receptor protein
MSFKLQGLRAHRAQRPLRTVVALVVPIFCLAPAFAADSDEGTELETLTVKASPLGGTADDLVQPVDVLSGEALQRKRKATIGEMLEGELGVSTSDFGPGVGRPIIRGEGGPRVQVLENGIGSMDLSSASDDHAVTIDPANATQVEIIKGPATLIYGSGASAGLVNVVNGRLPEQLSDGLHAKGEFSYADNGNDRNSSADLAYGIGHFMLHGDFAERRALGDFKINGFQQPDDQGADGYIPNSAVRTQSASVGGSVIGDAGMFGLAGSLYNNRYGIPENPGDAKFLNLYQKRLDTQGILNKPFSFLESLRARVGINNYEHQELGDAASPGGTTFLNHQVDARLEATHVPLSGWRGVVGTQVINRNASAVGDEILLPQTLTRELGLYVVEERPYHFGRIELGARIEKQQQRPDAANGNPDRSYPDRDFTPLSVSAGTVIKLGEKHHVHFNASRSQRAPSAEELYTFGGHDATASFERGDPNLKNETAYDFEVGLDRHHDRVTWKANVFYKQVHDYVYLQDASARKNADGSDADPATVAAFGPNDPDRVDGEGNLDPNGELLLVDVRQANAKLYGAETEVAYAILQGPFSLNGRVFGDTVRGKLDAGDNLPRITPMRYGVGFDGGYREFNADLTLTRIAAQNKVAPVETTTAGYTLLSADIGYTLRASSTATTFYVRGRNLLDQFGRRHTSFLKDTDPIPGRTFIVGVRAEFN